MAKVRELLELTNEPVALISRSVGYLDMSNFHRLLQRGAGSASRHESPDRRTGRRVSRRGSVPLPPDSS
ncbi:hypothetical protein [Streptomyces sp. NPDC056632]|uniref:hypothetical protein n=1 Tax=Streptomyces sp. NPDC056632 TaxID=3345884 RepID=UPI0036A6E055